MLTRSGSANLSTDYFTNRQDRYHIFSCGKLTDYFARIHHAVTQISYQVLPDENSEQGYNLVWPGSNPAPPPTLRPLEFKTAATALLTPLIKGPANLPGSSDTVSHDTHIYPLGQFTPLFRPLDTSTEIVGLSALLRLLTRPDFAGSKWTFTAGYFNIHPTLKALLLASRSAQGTIITASPEANGFYKSAGISGHLPPAYTILSTRFLQGVFAAGKQNCIHLKEWKRGKVGEPSGWTYHAKGTWVCVPHRHRTV